MYFGVPFAKPPVGELRWKAPQALENWQGILKTTKFGPKPVQTEVYGKMNSRLDTMSEDCLYLNVWAPSQKSKKKTITCFSLFLLRWICCRRWC